MGKSVQCQTPLLACHACLMACHAWLMAYHVCLMACYRWLMEFSDHAQFLRTIRVCLLCLHAPPPPEPAPAPVKTGHLGMHYKGRGLRGGSRSGSAGGWRRLPKPLRAVTVG